MQVGKLAKLNPSNLFSSMMGDSTMLTTYSSYASIYSQMMDDKEILENSYDVLAGHWPKKYNEMIIVLSEKSTISDLLVYSLGLRDTDELTTIITKVMSGETVEINNKPMTFTYEDLLNVDLRLIRPTDTYIYNSRYDIYEDMSQDKEYMQNLYDNAIPLKIVGIVTAKEGTTTMALNPGVNYTSDLIEYIIDYSSNADIVKKQIDNPEINVISGKRFDSDDDNELGLDFADLVSIDTNMLSSAFNVNIDQKAVEEQTKEYMMDVASSVSTDTTDAKNDFTNALSTMCYGILDGHGNEVTPDNIDTIVENYLNEYQPSNLISSLEEKYLIPAENFRTVFSGLLKGLLQVYISSNSIVDPTSSNNVDEINSRLSEENIQMLNQIAPELGNRIVAYLAELQTLDMNKIVVPTYINSVPIQGTISTMAGVMTEAVVKKDVLTKMGELTGNLANTFASSFNVDQNKIANAFTLKVTEDEITRLITAMMTKKDANAKTNLISLGYQDKDEPTFIAFYFNSFEGKEHFMDFIDKYNEKVLANGEDDKEIKYTDTTGILMNSVKIIVNAVTYVLIAFVSISLVVSSIMIGIITYISVYERTKEIGILRAIGASKHNISTIFNAETFIVGLLSGMFGIGISLILIPIINAILHHFTGNIPLNATLEVGNIVVLVTLSVILTLIGGLIPAKKASKKDPVIALRTE